MHAQNKEMRRYAPTPRPSEPRPRGSASGLTAQYLEAVEDAYETDEDDDPGLSATERARRNLQRRSAEAGPSASTCLNLNHEALRLNSCQIALHHC